MEISPNDRVKTLIEFYKDNVAYQRHHEEIRFKGSQLILALSGALIATFQILQKSAISYGVSAFLVVLGFLGIAQVLKHAERADRHARIARAIRDEIGRISTLNGAVSIADIHSEAAKKHKNKAGFIFHWKARYFWLAMHVVVVFIGIGAAIWNYIR